MKYLFIFIGLALITATCKEDPEIQSKDYPYVITGEVSEISSTGATFEAKIIDYGKEEITDFGFKWTDGKTEFEISLMNSGNTDNFKVRISTDLEKEVSYRVNAYAQTKNHLVLGPVVSFKSLGSELPIITSFAPTSGLDGTTITITGKYFSKYANGNRVRIGSAYAKVIHSSEDEIIIESPRVSYYGKYKITLEVAGQIVNSDDDYTILGPTVTSVTPLDAGPGDILTITGDWLIDSTDGVEIRFNGYQAEIVSSSLKQVVVIVPPHYLDYKTIQIKAGLKSLDISYAVKLTQHFIDLIPPGLTGDINGVSCSTQTRGFLFSYGSLWEFDPVSDTWTIASQYPGEGDLNMIMFSLNDKVYIGGGYGLYGPDNCVDFWEFDPALNSWKKLTDFPTRYASNGFGLNDRAYLLGDRNENSLWQYNPETDSWNQMPGTPPIGDGLTLVFAIHNTAYIKIRRFLNNFFEFSESTGDWIQRADCPMEYECLAFASSNKGYCIDYWGEMFEYNTVSDTWLNKLPYPGCTGRLSFHYGFSIENKIYVGNGPMNYDVGCQPSFYNMVP